MLVQALYDQSQYILSLNEFFADYVQRHRSCENLITAIEVTEHTENSEGFVIVRMEDSTAIVIFSHSCISNITSSLRDSFYRSFKASGDLGSDGWDVYNNFDFSTHEHSGRTFKALIAESVKCYDSFYF